MCKKVTEFDTLDAVERAATKAALIGVVPLWAKSRANFARESLGTFTI